MIKYDPNTLNSKGEYTKQDSLNKNSLEGNVIHKDETTKKNPLQVYFPNKITWFCFWCFLWCKSVQESFFYEVPQVMKEYYNWSTADVGYAICCSMTFAIPISLSIAPLSKKMEDRQILFWSLCLYLVGIVLKINFNGKEPMNLYLYIVASAILFVGSLISETAAISILSKVISPLASESL